MDRQTTMPPTQADGLRRFDEIHARLPSLIEELCKEPAKTRAQHGDIPTKAGVYLFSENGSPLYVGQTRNLRQRLALHTRLSSTQEQASFAFNLAKRNAAKKGLQIDGPRKVVANDQRFKVIFDRAKARVARMDVRFIEIGDPELRTIFEVYAALALGTTEFNSFETH